MEGRKEGRKEGRIDRRTNRWMESRINTFMYTAIVQQQVTTNELMKEQI